MRLLVPRQLDSGSGIGRSEDFAAVAGEEGPCRLEHPDVVIDVEDSVGVGGLGRVADSGHGSLVEQGERARKIRPRARSGGRGRGRGQQSKTSGSRTSA